MVTPEAAGSWDCRGHSTWLCGTAVGHGSGIYDRTHYVMLAVLTASGNPAFLLASLIWEN